MAGNDLPPFVEKNITPEERAELALYQKQMNVNKIANTVLKLAKKYAKTPSEKAQVAGLETNVKIVTGETPPVTQKSEKKFPVWGYGTIGIGTCIVAGLIYYFIKRR